VHGLGREIRLSEDARLAPLGHPEYREHDAGNGLAVVVGYREDGSLEYVEIRAQRPMLVEPVATPIDAADAEVLLDELFPASVRGEEVWIHAAECRVS
jgi:hypothetical protein